MKRLLDSPHAAEPELERLARLLDHVPPVADEVERRRRVRLAMQTRPASSWHLGRGALVVVLLLVAGVAAAAGQRLLRSSRSVASAPPASVAARPAAVAELPAAIRNNRVEPASSSPAPLPSVTSAASAAAPIALPRAAKRLAAAAPSGDDPGTRLMVEAMQARSAGRYGRALALLTDYQRRFPGGALQDEALALQVEMTSLQGGSERARALGRAYLARFPNGRYRAWVSQSLAAAEP